MNFRFKQQLFGTYLHSSPLNFTFNCLSCILSGNPRPGRQKKHSHQPLDTTSHNVGRTTRGEATQLLLEGSLLSPVARCRGHHHGHVRLGHSAALHTEGLAPAYNAPTLDTSVTPTFKIFLHSLWMSLLNSLCEVLILKINKYWTCILSLSDLF